MKTRRQSAVLDILRQQPVRSQEQLRRRLHAAGFDVTQATLSRDIRELGLVKGGQDGAYRLPASVQPNAEQAASMLHRTLADYLTRVDRVQQLVLVRTGPGRAPLLGVAIDGAQLPEVVGTLAGDDTILIITPDARRARTLVKRLEEMTHA
jgi:transcriptional regulator of arginine metabolism